MYAFTAYEEAEKKKKKKGQKHNEDFKWLKMDNVSFKDNLTVGHYRNEPGRK